jgi:hypothetical protein
VVAFAGDTWSPAAVQERLLKAADVEEAIALFQRPALIRVAA